MHGNLPQQSKERIGKRYDDLLLPLEWLITSFKINKMF